MVVYFQKQHIWLRKSKTDIHWFKTVKKYKNAFKQAIECIFYG